MPVAVSEFPFDQAFRGEVDAAGELVVSWDSGGLVNWNVQQVSVEMPDAPVGAACFLRKQGKLVSNMIATGDTAAGDPSVYLKPGETMTVEWTGCTPGDVGVVFVIYQKVGFAR